MDWDGVSSILQVSGFADDLKDVPGEIGVQRCVGEPHPGFQRARLQLDGAGELGGGLAMEVAVGEDATELKTERRFVDGTADGEEGGEVAEPTDLIRQLLAQRDRVATSRAEVFIEPDVDGGADVYRVQLLGGFEESAGVLDAISALEGHAPGVGGRERGGRR